MRRDAIRPPSGDGEVPALTIVVEAIDRHDRTIAKCAFFGADAPEQAGRWARDTVDAVTAAARVVGDTRPTERVR